MYILGQYGTSLSGHKIYENYDDKVHCAPEVMRPVTKDQLVIGMDFGLNAAAAVTQLTPRGGMQVLGEVVGEDEMFEQFLDEKLVPYLVQEFRNWPVLVVGDPSDNTGRASYSLLHSRRIAAQPSVTNDPVARWDAVKWFLHRVGGFSMSPVCVTMREGFLGGYFYRKTSGSASSGPKHTGQAQKNHCSHIHDALQYAALYHRMESLRSTRPKPSAPKKGFLFA